MMRVIFSSKPSDLTRATRHHIPEDGILHSHCRENLKSYMDSSGPGQSQRANSCEQGTKPFNIMKGMIFLD
jgi:hypothetical protein